MERFLIPSLMDALNKAPHKPIYILGGPCLGKSYTLREIARKYGRSYILCDCKIDTNLCQALEEALKVGDSLYEFLKKYFQLDEPLMEQMLFLLDGYELLSVNAAKQILERRLPRHFAAAVDTLACRTELLPEDAETFYLKPFSFAEFLEGINEHWYRTVVEGSTRSNEPIPKLIADQLQELFHDFLMVGGYPQAIMQYNANKTDLTQLYGVHEAIWSVTMCRFQMYFSNQDELPHTGFEKGISLTRLQQLIGYYMHYGKSLQESFRPTYIRKGATAAEYQAELSYLFESGIMLPICSGDALFRFEIADEGLARYLLRDYAAFYTMDEEESALPAYFYQNYLYCECNHAAKRIPTLTIWRQPRTSYATLVSQEQKTAYFCNSILNKSTIKNFHLAYKDYSTVVLSDNEKSRNRSEHNIQYYAFAPAQVFKKRF